MCVIDIFSKHARIVILKDKKGVSIFNAFQKVLDDSNRSEAKSKGCEPDKICFDKGSEFYNNSFKKWLKDDDIKVYSIRKSVVAERFIRTLKTKIYKYMTLVSKNEYVHKLGDIVDEYNNIHHRTINMEPANVKDNTYIDFKREVNEKHPRFKVGNRVRISKYKNIFAKGCTPNWSEEVFVNSKIKNTVPWAYVINDPNGEEITGIFNGKELLKTNKKIYRIEKILRRKGDKLYIKWKGYDSSFNSWIDKKDLA